MSMSSFGPGSSDPFSELLNRFFGMSPASSPPAVQRVPVGRLLTESSRQLLNLASRRALEDGTSDLDTEHLLWAATRVEPARGLLARAGADPDALASRIAEALPRESGEPSAEPGLTPAAKRTLATAYARSQAAGVSYIGPEHILGALLDGDSGAARLLGAEGRDLGALEGLTEQAGRADGAPGEGGGRKPATTLDEFGGVGKTELAKTLAELLFGEESRMTRFDMSEFQEKHTVARLVGAPPGYVGYEEAGQLTEKVRRQPYSVVLFDEVEKAHPDVFNTLLQILDDGRLTDAQGRTVDFRHCVVIMTSNIGAHRILDHQGDVSDLKDELTQELRGRFLPEFLNRIDDIIVFHGLTEDDLSEIVDHLLAQSERRVHAQGMKLTVTESARKLLVAHGHQPEFGARPLRRTIQTEPDNRIADLLLGGEADPGDTIVADVREDSLHCTVRKGGAGESGQASAA